MLPFQNNSNKAVKKIKVSVRQFADICLFSTAQYKCTVDEKVNSSASKRSIRRFVIMEKAPTAYLLLWFNILS